MVKMEPLAPDTWYTLRWRITEEGMEVAVDDRTIFTEKRIYDLSPAEPVGVCAMRSPVDVKSFVVRELPRLAKKPPPDLPPLPHDTPLDELDPAKVPPEDRYPGFGDALVAVLKGHTGEIFAVQFAPNGKFLASTGNDGKVIVWYPLDAKPMRELLTGAGSLAGIAISPDSTKVACATRNDMQIWDVTQWPPPAQFVSIVPTMSIPGEMAWSPDGQLIACSRNGRAELVDVSRPRPRLRPSAGGAKVGHGRLCFTRDSQTLALSDGTGVTLWDVTADTPKMRQGFSTPSQPKGMAISPDGKKLAITHLDTSMRLWDMTTTGVVDIPAPRKQITFDSSAAYSPDGKTVLTTGLDQNGRPTATWRSGEDFSLIREWPLPERSSQVAFDATGRYAAVTSHNKKLYIVRLPAATAPAKPKPPMLPGAGEGAHFRTDVRGNVRLLADQRQALVGGAGLAVVDIASGQTINTLQPRGKIIGSGGEVAVSAASPRALSAATSYNLTYVWDLKSQELKHVLKGHEGLILAVAISPDGTRGLTGSGGIDIVGKKAVPREASLRLWDLDQGTEIGKYEAHGGDILTTVFLGDGLKALTGGHDGTICLWDFSQTTALVKTIKAHAARTYALAVAAKARRLISTGADKKVRLWDLDTLSELHTFDVPIGARHVAVDDAGRYAALSVGKQITVYDLRDRKEIAGFALPMTARGVAIAANGRFVVATNLSGTLSVWQVPIAPEAP
jgi:WD40 repeat protein